MVIININILFAKTKAKLWNDGVQKSLSIVEHHQYTVRGYFDTFNCKAAEGKFRVRQKSMKVLFAIGTSMCPYELSPLYPAIYYTEPC